MKKSLSILILSIEGREHYLKRCLQEINRQANKYGIKQYLEVLVLPDKKGENSIGAKRNVLLQNSTGKYCMFIDDDDIYKSDCLAHIVYEINNSKFPFDCIKLEGIITENGLNPKKFIHSLKYTDYSEDSEAYYRPPNHLNAIKSSIAKQFKFPELNHGEDTDWAMQIARSGLLKVEKDLRIEPYYDYQYITNK